MTIEYKNNCSLYVCFDRYYINDIVNNKEFCIGSRTNMTVQNAREIFFNYISSL
jgi:hypothetical protein